MLRWQSVGFSKVAASPALGCIRDSIFEMLDRTQTSLIWPDWPDQDLRLTENRPPREDCCQSQGRTRSPQAFR